MTTSRLLLSILFYSLFVGNTSAQTFDDSIFGLLADNCSVLRDNQIAEDNPEILLIGPNLAQVCGFQCTPNPNPGPGDPPFSCVLAAGTDGSPTGGGSQQTVGSVLPQRLRELREKDENGQQVAQPDPVAGGVFQIGNGPSIYASLDFDDRSKDATRFEDGYNSNEGRVTFGGDYRVTRGAVLGLALTYSEFSGDFDGGGDFETNTIRGFAYGSFTVSENGFIEAVLEFAEKDFERTRQAFFSRAQGVGPGSPVTEFGGAVNSKFDGNDFGASVLAGYDYARGNLTIGPRIGLKHLTTDFDAYEETGGTGLELRIAADERKSFQTRLGAQGSLAFSTASNVILPQFQLTWVRELDDDQRIIRAEFAEDDRAAPIGFAYQTEEPDRDFVELDLGVAAIFRNGLSAYANFRTYLGNSRYDLYATTAGLRKEF